MFISETSRKFLLKLARKVIEKKIDKKNDNVNGINNDIISSVLSDMSLDKIPEDIKLKRAVFVTLTKKGGLRGCIGHLQPVQEIYKDVIENSYSAAFRDPRFRPVHESEIDDISIEISVLSLPEKFHYKSIDDIYNKINPNVHGIILSKNGRLATFLPQVWEQLSTHDEFFNHLCAKAGLAISEWKNLNVEIETYTVENFNE